jgi:fructosamine-3-kinase
MESVVNEIVAALYPQATVTTARRIRTGNFKQTVLVDLADRESLVVQYRSLDHGHLRPEARVTEVIGEETEVPVPDILGVGQVDDRSYIVTHRVPGINLHERFESLPEERRLALTRTLGRFLGALHQRFTFPQYGPVVAINGGLTTTGDDVSWQAWLRSYVEEGLDAMESPLRDLRPRIERTLDAGVSSLPSAPTPRLYPWDYRPGNVLLDERETPSDRIAAVLDWADPLAAHRELSLAKAEFLTADWYADPPIADRLREAFYKGYQERMAVDDGYWDTRRRLYRLVALVRSAFDSQGAVTLPRYPMVEEEEALAFHRTHIEAVLDE